MAEPLFVRDFPDDGAAFLVTGREYDPAAGEARLRYRFEGGPAFEEVVTFEGAPAAVAHPDRLHAALAHLHVAAGTSYYKTAAPHRVVVDGDPGPDGLEAHRLLYDDGLREFAVANDLPVPRDVEVVPAPGSGPTPAAAPTSSATGRRRILVPIGGGKDSMVLAEALRPLGATLFAVNPRPFVVELAAEAGMDLVVVRRRLDPALADLNRRGARNGHVPITAIVSLLAVAAGAVWGYDTVVMAVERSASEETRTVGGVPVNHQYSKSLAFERVLAALVRSAVDPGVTWGSGLRPYSELAITRAFARLGRYRTTFCSCNTVFRQDAPPGARWCGRCPKCRFVALMLAPFVTPDELTAVFGRNLLADDDAGAVAGFAALMSDAAKPFECVGERRESAVALRLLADLPAWRQSAVVGALAPEAARRVGPSDVEAVLTPDPSLAFPDARVADAVDRVLAVR